MSPGWKSKMNYEEEEKKILTDKLAWEVQPQFAILHVTILGHTSPSNHM